jgi:luciferase family oxidoreductase group 1
MFPEEMSNRLEISVLDQSPVSEGSTGAQALQQTVDLARLADQLGYRRYWIAEHHATPMLASASPEVLIAAVGSATSRIRVGSGGVMLPYYSPLKVAENFSILSGLSPGRIDLGVGRAPGTDQHTMLALQRDRRQYPPDDFPEQLAELHAYLHDEFPRGHALARLAALPGRPEVPELWLLGSSPDSAVWAAEFGLPYAFADFINPNGASIAASYRTRFTPSNELAEPRVVVAVSAICAETDEEALQLATSQRMVLTLLRAGRLLPVPPPETAAAFLAARPLSEGWVEGRRAIVGSPATVRAGLEKVAAEYGADEVMVVTITYEHEARKRSYELIAEAFELERAAEPAISSPAA